MYYNVLKVKDIVDLEKGESFDKNVLLENNNGEFTIIAIKKGKIIDTHTSKEDAVVFVIDGEIEIHFTAEKFKLDKGELIMFKKDVEHKVLALKDSKFFVVKI